MIKIWSILAGLIIQSSTVFGIATATFETKTNHRIQILIDGKLINKQPKKRVKIKGRSGNHDLVIKVYDEAGCLTYEYEDNLFITSGFQSDFGFWLKPENCVELDQVKVSRIYSERIRRPDDFYNKKLITAIATNFSEAIYS